jgi:hypothetical protein
VSRLGRSQPIQPFSSHGFLGNVPPNGVLPGRVVVVENDERQLRRRRLPEPVSINGLYAISVAQTIAPPPSQFVAEPERGKARLPVPPVAVHGLLDSGVGVPGITPPASVNLDRPDRPRNVAPQPTVDSGFDDSTPQQPEVFEPEDRRRRYWPLPSISVSGVLASFLQLFVSPPPPVVVDATPRGRATAIPDAKTSHGFVDSGVGVPGTTPPLPVSIDRADQRVRFRPLDAITLNGLLASLVSAPPATPPGPFVVPLEERRRFLAALPASATHGVDDAVPQPADVFEPEDRRRRYQPLQPLVISGVLAPFFPPFVQPPAPLVVFIDGIRRLVPQPVVLFGPAFPVDIIGAIYTQPFAGPNPGGPSFTGAPDLGGFTGTPDDGELVGAPGGNTFGPPTPGRSG